MKRIGFSLVLLGLLCGGCLQQARTPYNEVGLFSGNTLGEAGEELQTPPDDAVSLWPFYISDGRASYYLWPLIKNSPGCFAALPFYNYDKGIHDIALLCTLSPKSGEYRVFPFWWKNREGWTLFPIAYSYGEGNDCLRGLPFVWNYYRDGSDYGHFSFPFYWYGADTARGRSRFVSLPFSYNISDKRRTFTALLGLYRYYESKKDKDYHQWLFPFWFDWQDGAIGQQNTLLFPLYFARTYDAGDHYRFTPFAGWGASEAHQAKWWYALTAGASQQGEFNRTSWCLPLYWHDRELTDERFSTSLWTPFWTYKTATPRPALEHDGYDPDAFRETRWSLGPILPLLADGSETPKRSKLSLLLSLGYHAEDTYATTSTRSGMEERVSLAVSSRSALWTLLFHSKTYHRTFSPENGGAAFSDSDYWYTCPGLAEGREFSLLAGLYSRGDVTRYGRNKVLQFKDEGLRKRALRLGWLLWHHEVIESAGARVTAPDFDGRLVSDWSCLLLGGLWAREEDSTRLSSAEFAKDPRRPTTYATNTESSWTLGWTLLGHAWERRQHEWSESKQDFVWSDRSRRGFGKLLYNHEWQIGAKGERITGNYKTGLLLDFFNVSRRCNADRTDNHFDFKFGWGLLYSAEIDRWEDGDAMTEHALLVGLPLSAESRRWVTRRKNPVSGKEEIIRTSDNEEVQLGLGLLYNREARSNQEHSYQHYYCKSDEDGCCARCSEHPDDPCESLLKREASASIEDDLLLGILYHRVLDDRRVWSRENVTATTEALTLDRYADDRYVLFGIPWQWHGDRNGGYKQTSLWGLLFDQTVKPNSLTRKTESFGILGFLYRYNKYQDGSTTRFIFPFITTTANEEKDTWRFSFLHKLFRLEKLPDGTLDWTLFWL